MLARSFVNYETLLLLFLLLRHLAAHAANDVLNGLVVNRCRLGPKLALLARLKLVQRSLVAISLEAERTLVLQWIEYRTSELVEIEMLELALPHPHVFLLLVLSI